MMRGRGDLLAAGQQQPGPAGGGGLERRVLMLVLQPGEGEDAVLLGQALAAVLHADTDVDTGSLQEGGGGGGGVRVRGGSVLLGQARICSPLPHSAQLPFGAPRVFPSPYL